MLLRIALALFVTVLAVAAAPAPLGTQGAPGLAKRQAAGVVTTCQSPGQVALTFDDGPVNIARIAALLDSYDVKGTFFLNGWNFDCIYSHAPDVKAAFDSGHLLASHTWSHPDTATLSAAQVNDQLWRIEDALIKSTGAEVRFFRPPYGSYDGQALSVASQRGYTTVLWNFDAGDALGRSASEIISAYNSLSYPDSYIALNHETVSATVDTVLPAVIPALLSRGYELVTVAECLGQSAYQSVGAPSARDDSWTCSGTPPPGEAW
ncbi:hypothetical protein JCM10450v2_007515 [Rhodotorula kratochvilovae]